MVEINYNSEIMEKFAIKTITNSYNEKCKDYIWHDKDDDFDFTSVDDKCALEVTTIISTNEKNAMEYLKALNKTGKAKVNKVLNYIVDVDGELLSYYGGSMNEIKDIILERILDKELKRAKRKKKYVTYELCLCVNDGGLLCNYHDFDYLISNNVIHKTDFSRLFIITCSNFYLMENDTITEYNRIIK